MYTTLSTASLRVTSAMSASDGGGALPTTVSVKEEPDWDHQGESGAGAAAGEDLYAEHEVKEELVLGPRRLQPQDIAHALHVSETVDESKNITEEQLAASAEDGRLEDPVQSGRADSVLRPCTVKLECISIKQLLHACTSCHKKFLHEASLETHMCAQGDSGSSVLANSAIGDDTCSNTKTYVCDNCRKQFVLKLDLVRHLKINVKEPHICKICEKLFFNICSLHDHKRIHLTCDICLKVFKCLSDFKMHKGVHSDKKPYSCVICNKNFKFNTSLTKHLLGHAGDHRSRDGRPACDICNKALSDLRCLANHKLFHYQTKPFSCDVCKLTFRTRSDLIPHMRVHFRDKPYSCDICKKKFTLKSTLNDHKTVHTGEKRFACKICHKAYRYRTSLSMHMSTHSDKKPFACEICHKAFKYRKALSKHRIVHTEDRPYVCEICGKKFKRKDKLTQHTLTHSRDKRFVCDTCSKPFLRKAHLMKHLIHSKHPTYSCEICKKRFSFVAHLDRHMSIHPGAKPPTCDVCKKKFISRSSLRRHKRKGICKAG